jgi:hypothetical protein
VKYQSPKDAQAGRKRLGFRDDKGRGLCPFKNDTRVDPNCQFL